MRFYFHLQNIINGKMHMIIFLEQFHDKTVFEFMKMLIKYTKNHQRKKNNYSYFH